MAKCVNTPDPSGSLPGASSLFILQVSRRSRYSYTGVRFVKEPPQE